MIGNKKMKCKCGTTTDCKDKCKCCHCIDEIDMAIDMSYQSSIDMITKYAMRQTTIITCVGMVAIAFVGLLIFLGWYLK